MGRSVLMRIWVWMVSLVVVTGALADQPEPADVARLQELEKAAAEHERAGRGKETIASFEQLLDLERLVYGDGSDQALGSRRKLARLHEQQEAFTAAQEE